MAGLHTAPMTPARKAASVIRPADAALAAAAEVLNDAGRVTILAGAGCAGAHDQLMEFAGALQARSCTRSWGARSSWSTTTA